MDARTRQPGWGWPWRLLALLLVAAGVAVVHRVIRQGRERPAVQPVVFSGTEKCAAERIGIQLNDNFRGGHPAHVPEDSPELILPPSWNGKVLEADVELQLSPSKSAVTVSLYQFDDVQELVNGVWLPLRPTVRLQGRSPGFHVDVRPGKHSFRGLFSTITRSGFAADPWLFIYPTGEKDSLVTYRITVKPVE